MVGMSLVSPLGHMVLHLPHYEDDFGLTFNDITKDVAFYHSTLLRHAL